MRCMQKNDAQSTAVPKMQSFIPVLNLPKVSPNISIELEELQMLYSLHNLNNGENLLIFVRDQGTKNTFL